jgi:hypothetical protein
MSILFNKPQKFQTGGATPKLVYKARKVSPFTYSWFSNPITIGKLNEISPGLSDKMNSALDKANVIDMNYINADNSKALINDTWSDMDIPKSRKSLDTNAINRIFMLSSDKLTSGVSRLKDGSPYIGVRLTNAPDMDPRGYAAHELMHNPVQSTIENYINKRWGNKLLSEDQLKTVGILRGDEGTNRREFWNYARGENGYESEGIYPRIMELRKSFNKAPGDQWTIDELKAIPFEDSDSPLRALRFRYDDDTILDILNNVAYNKQKNNNILTA